MLVVGFFLLFSFFFEIYLFMFKHPSINQDNTASIVACVVKVLLGYGYDKVFMHKMRSKSALEVPDDDVGSALFLDKLDGLVGGSKRKRESDVAGIEDLFQLPDDYATRMSQPGKKRVIMLSLPPDCCHHTVMFLLLLNNLDSLYG